MAKVVSMTNLLRELCNSANGKIVYLTGVCAFNKPITSDDDNIRTSFQAYYLRNNGERVLVDTYEVPEHVLCDFCDRVKHLFLTPNEQFVLQLTPRATLVYEGSINEPFRVEFTSYDLNVRDYAKFLLDADRDIYSVVMDAAKLGIRFEMFARPLANIPDYSAPSYIPVKAEKEPEPKEEETASKPSADMNYFLTNDNDAGIKKHTVVDLVNIIDDFNKKMPSAPAETEEPKVPREELEAKKEMSEVAATLRQQMQMVVTNDEPSQVTTALNVDDGLDFDRDDTDDEKATD